ncbi:hypothetical protein [Streptomyces sp.]|uniref:hypothetical protein n=1 Tax=Streptomyces sp. TaxID=1931 RepID=UPI002F3E432D
MNSRKARQIAIVVASGVIAAGNGNVLAQHHVGIVGIVASVAAIFFTGLTLAGRVAGRPQTFACPDPGCDVTIRTTGYDADANHWYRTLAEDHTRHGRATTV